MYKLLYLVYASYNYSNEDLETIFDDSTTPYDLDYNLDNMKRYFTELKEKSLTMK